MDLPATPTDDLVQLRIRLADETRQFLADAVAARGSVPRTRPILANLQRAWMAQTVITCELFRRDHGFETTNLGRCQELLDALAATDVDKAAAIRTAQLDQLQAIVDHRNRLVAELRGRLTGATE